MSHSHSHSHGGKECSHNHGHDHSGHSHGAEEHHAIDMAQPPPEHGHHKLEDIIRENVDGAESGEMQLDEYNMWNAAALGNFSFLELALPRFPYIVSGYDADGQSLLHWAALHNDIAAATALLRAGTEVDVLAKKTLQTPVMWATTRGHIEMIRLLVSHGANAHHKDSVGANALIIAVQYKEILTAHFLISKGFSATTPDQGGCNSMHWAAYMGVVPLLRLFHAKSPEADLKDDLGYTPLHRAVFGNCDEAVQFFVDNKYDMHIKNKEGETPLDMAVSMKRSPKMIKLLSDNKYAISMIKRIYDDPKMSLYVFPAFWVVCYFFTFYMYYTSILALTTETHALSVMLLGLFLVCHGGLYFYVARSDPGYIGDEKRIDFEQMVEKMDTEKTKIDTSRICFSCDIMKPMRSKHCRVCDRCVYRFDHHCGWTGNCVGVKNHPVFLAFVVVQEFVHILCTYLAFEALRASWEEDSTFFQNLLGHVALITVMLLHLFGTVMTGGLAKQQVQMMANNETTNEVINWARYPHFWRPIINSKDGRRGLAYTNPFSEGYKNNCEQFCFGAREEPEQKVFAKLDSVHIVPRN